MNQLAVLDVRARVCGCLHTDPLCVCVRPSGHFGPHVVLDGMGTYQLVQIVCSPIVFEIAQAVAQKAIADKNWTWEE